MSVYEDEEMMGEDGECSPSKDATEEDEADDEGEVEEREDDRRRDLVHERLCVRHDVERDGEVGQALVECREHLIRQVGWQTRRRTLRDVDHIQSS